MFVAPTGLQLVIFLPQSPQCWADKGLAGPNYFKWKRTRLKMNTVNLWTEHFGLLPTSSRWWDTQCWIPSTLVSKWLGLSLCKEKYKLKGQDESLANVQISRQGQKRHRHGRDRWLEASLDSARPCLRETTGEARRKFPNSLDVFQAGSRSSPSPHLFSGRHQFPAPERACSKL